jgi:hypothetical protein
MPEYSSYLTAEQLVTLIAKEQKNYDDPEFQRDALIDMCLEWVKTNPNGVPPKPKGKKEKEFVLDVDKKQIHEMYYGATSVLSWFKGFKTAKPDDENCIPSGLESLDTIKTALKPYI